MTTDTDIPNRADGGSQSQPEGRSGETDLDKALAEFQTAVPEKNPAVETSKSIDVLARFAAESLAEKANERTKTDIDKAVSFVKDGGEVPDTFVSGFLHYRAAEDPEFKAAWENRTKAPKAWDAALAKAKSDFAGEVTKLPGNRIKTDVEAARNSIRGGTETPGDPDKLDPVALRKMSDQEWEKVLEREYAKNAR